MAKYITCERELLKKILSTGWLNHYLSCEVEELLAQPEQEPVGIVRTIGGYPDDSDHIAEWTCSFKYLKDGDRLYLAPPKREPLGERIEVPSGNTDYVFGFCDGVLYAEKEHGIGDKL